MRREENASVDDGRFVRHCYCRVSVTGYEGKFLDVP